MLAPWRLAPWLGLRQRLVCAAVFGAALVMVGTAASPALFLSSASSATLRRLVAARCPDAAYPVVRAQAAGGGPAATSIADLRRAAALQRRSVATATELDHRIPQVLAAHDLPGPERVWVSAGAAAPTLPGPRAELRDVSWMYRSGALAHVHPIADLAGRDGIWVQESAAAAAGLRIGSTVAVGIRRILVVGVFADINGSAPGPFWCSQTALFSATNINQSFVPKLVLCTSPAIFLASQGGLTQTMTLDWWSPIETRGLTLSRAHDINVAAAAAVASLSRSREEQRRDDVFVSAQAGGAQNSLPNMEVRARLVHRGLLAPVVPIGAVGSLIALFLVIACGGLWADRRSREVTLLLARGVGAPALGLKAVLELSIPALAGVAAGWAVAVGLVRVVGPSSALDHSAPVQAAVFSALAGAVGLVSVGAAGAIRARKVFERVGGRRRIGYPRWPWELIPLGLAALAFWRLHDEKPVDVINGVAEVNLHLVTFPLLAIIGLAGLGIRVIVAGLPLVRTWGAGRSVPTFLATRRITATVIVSAAILGVVALPISLFLYSSAITGTTQKTVDAKSAVYSGAPHVIVSVEPISTNARTERVGSVVTRLSGQGVDLDGQQVEIIGVDPRTFVRFAIWHDQYATESLRTIASGLGGKDNGPAPIAIWYPRGQGSPHVNAARLHVGAVTIPVESVATVRAFPGVQDVYDPLIVIDDDRLGAAITDPTAQRRYEFWTKTDSPAVRAALAAQDVHALFVLSPAQVIDLTDYVAITWTFGYLEVLALLIAAVAVGGLLLHVATRQRAQVISYVLTRRMGLRRATHGLSLLIEQLTIVVAALLLGTALSAATVELVYRRLDVDPVHPPPPLLSVPLIQLTASAAGAVAVAAVAAAVAHISSEQYRPSEVLRTEA